MKRTKKESGKTKGKKSKSGREDLVSFMSADSQNKIKNSIGSQLLKVIVNEIKLPGSTALIWIAPPTVLTQINYP